jgi:hypothetical protein
MQAIGEKRDQDMDVLGKDGCVGGLQQQAGSSESHARHLLTSHPPSVSMAYASQDHQLPMRHTLVTAPATCHLKSTITHCFKIIITVKKINFTLCSPCILITFSN